MLRIYQIRNLPHAFAEIIESTPNINALIAAHQGVGPSPDAERLAPVVAAAIDNLQTWITTGAQPPRSWINGRAVDETNDGTPDRIVFTRLNGTTTSFTPFIEEPALDVFVDEPIELSAAGGFGGTVIRYAEVLAALDHVSGGLNPPYLTCRLGGYQFGADATLEPFGDFGQHWRNLGQYKSCIERSMNALASERLYDRALGIRVIYSDENLALFGH